MKTKTKKVAKKNTPAAKAIKKRGPVPAVGMSGYIVVWRHTMDDVPLGLFKTLPEALKAAKTTSFRAGFSTARKLGFDCSTPVCFVVIGFENGKATKLVRLDRPDDAC